MASAFWPTRLIARRRARDLFDIVAGFAYSQTLFACVQLGLFALLRDGPLAHEALCDAMELDDDAARALLDAAVALKLLERTAPREYGLGVLGAAVVDDEGIDGMVRHHAYFYRDMADPVALLKERGGNTALSSYWPYAHSDDGSGMDADIVARYTALMSASQPMVCAQVHAAYRLARHRHLLDVGGGNGAFLISVARRAPGLKLSLFDMEPVTRLARENLQAAGLLEKVSVCAGDFSVTPFPEGADVISLVRVLHDHDDDVVATLLAKVRASLPPGGTVLIAEPLAETAGAPRMGSVYFAFYLRAMGSGRPRRFDELRDLLHRAGFVAVQQKKTPIPMLASVVHARVPD